MSLRAKILVPAILAATTMTAFAQQEPAATTQGQEPAATAHDHDHAARIDALLELLAKDDLSPEDRERMRADLARLRAHLQGTKGTIGVVQQDRDLAKVGRAMRSARKAAAEQAAKVASGQDLPEVREKVERARQLAAELHKVNHDQGVWRRAAEDLAATEESRAALERRLEVAKVHHDQMIAKVHAQELERYARAHAEAAEEHARHAAQAAERNALAQAQKAELHGGHAKAAAELEWLHAENLDTHAKALEVYRHAQAQEMAKATARGFDEFERPAQVNEAPADAARGDAGDVRALLDEMRAEMAQIRKLMQEIRGQAKGEGKRGASTGGGMGGGHGGMRGAGSAAGNPFGGQSGSWSTGHGQGQSVGGSSPAEGHGTANTGGHAHGAAQSGGGR